MADEFEQPEQEIIVPELFEEPELPDDADDAFARAEEGVETDDLVVSVEPPPAPIGRSWAFDFAAKRFVMAGHAPVETRREQTILYWIQKCLLTAQGGSPIEPADYGMDGPTDIFGTQVDSVDSGSLEDRIREALLFHPSITGIEGFSMNADAEDEEAAQVRFQAVLDDDTRLDVAAGVTF